MKRALKYIEMSGYKPLIMALGAFAILSVILMASGFWKNFNGKKSASPESQYSNLASSNGTVYLENEDAVLSGINGGRASGQANRSYKNGVFALNVKTKGLSAPSSKQFYSAWLIDLEGNTKTRLTGKLLKGNDAGSYTLNFEVGENLTSYKKLYVMLANEDGTNVKGVLEGTFVK